MMFKKIGSLSKISVQSALERLMYKDKKKINSKSVYLWAGIVIMILMYTLSYRMIEELEGSASGFVVILVIVMFFVLLIQSASITPDILYFSKDLENYTYLPLKSYQLLLMRFFKIVSTLYIIELLLFVTPLIACGVLVQNNILFIFNILLVLIIFPILLTFVVCLFNFIIIKFIKVFKNKAVIQILSIALVFVALFVLIFFSINTSTEMIIENILPVLSEAIVVVNMFAEIILEVNLLDNYLKLFGMIIILFIIFLIIGSKTYLRDVLKVTFYKKENIDNKKNYIKKVKFNEQNKSLLKQELKIFKLNNILAINSTISVLTTIIMIIVIGVVIHIDYVRNNIETASLIKDYIITTENIGLIILFSMLIMLLQSISIIAISKFGVGAQILKIIPIKEHKKFLISAIPEVIANLPILIVLLITIKLILVSVSIGVIILIFICLIVINIFISQIGVLIDIKNPKLSWDTEYVLTKINKNKLLRYLVIIIISAINLYLTNILQNFEVNIYISIAILIIIHLILLIILNIKVSKLIKQQKLYNKIY